VLTVQSSMAGLLPSRNEALPHSQNNMRDTPSPAERPGLHPDDSPCPFRDAAGTQTLSGATAKIDYRGVYHLDGSRCPMFTLTRSGSRSPTDSDSSVTGPPCSHPTDPTFATKGSDSESVDTNVEEGAVFDGLTATNIDADWFYDYLYPFIRLAYGPQTLLDSIKDKDDPVLKYIEWGDMLATVLQKISDSEAEDVLDKYRAAVLQDAQSGAFAVKLARQGMTFGVMSWILCEAKKKGSLVVK
jgi:hypothetical protein